MSATVQVHKLDICPFRNTSLKTYFHNVEAGVTNPRNLLLLLLGAKLVQLTKIMLLEKKNGI